MSKGDRALLEALLAVPKTLLELYPEAREETLRLRALRKRRERAVPNLVLLPGGKP